MVSNVTKFLGMFYVMGGALFTGEVLAGAPMTLDVFVYGALLPLWVVVFIGLFYATAKGGIP